MPRSLQEQCDINYAVGLNPAFLAVITPQFLACLSTLVLIVIFSCQFFKRGCFHPNAKILVFCQMFFTSLFCIGFNSALGLHFYNVFFKNDTPCAFVKYITECMPFYYVYIFSIAGMVVNQVFLSTERVISSLYAQKYESFSYKLGLLFACTVFIISLCIVLFVMNDYDPMEMRATCSGIPISTGGRTTLLYTTVCCCDVISITLFVITWRINKKNNTVGHYVLGRRYQARENVNVIKMFAPVNISHFVVYCFYAIAAAIVRHHVIDIDPYRYPIIGMAVTVVPYYTTLELIVLHYALRKVEGKKNRFNEKFNEISRSDMRKAYFEGLEKQWN